MLITEVPEGRKGRYAHPPNVYRTAYGTWYGLVRIGKGQRWYSGTFMDVRVADAAVRAAKALRDRGRRAEVPQPIRH
jgi:hypothetical protein